MSTTSQDESRVRVEFVQSPARLPSPPAAGRVVLVDVAFAFEPEFSTVTEPFLEELGERLVGWIDHHDHPAWPEFEDDPRFVLVPKAEAPACPQLVTPELIGWLGPFELILAHADFDGCMTAAKLLGAGRAPYPEADEDARAIDDPGRGFVCSARGLRLDRAMDQARIVDPGRYGEVLEAIVRSLVAGSEPPALAEDLDELARMRLEQEGVLAGLLERARRPHPELLLLEVERGLPGADKKWLLRELEARAAVAVLVEGGYTTAATFRTSGPGALDLAAIEGLKGSAGYAWGQLEPAWLVERIAAQLERQS